MPELALKHRSSKFSKSPLAALAASFALGIVWAHTFQASVGIPWFLAGAAACILIGLILLREDWERAAMGLVLASMMFTGVGAARRWEQRFPLTHVRYLQALGVNPDESVRLTGRIITTPYRTGYGAQFDVEAQRIESHAHVYSVTGKIRVRAEGWDDREDADGGSAKIGFGDVIQTEVRLRPPHIYRNPGSFDYRQWMEDIEDLHWIGTVKNPRQMEKVGHAAGFRFAEFVEHVRQRLLRGIDDIYPPWSPEGRNGAVLKAVLWGDRTALDSTTIDDFRKTGLYHLLVIAGLHLGLITMLVEFLLRGLGLRRVPRALMLLGFMVIYAFLVEQRAPTLRATLMIGLYLLARILDRGHSPLNSLGGVALILLYCRPAWLFESGFQLSFSAALLIVSVAVPILERTTEPYRRALRRLDDVLLDDYFSPRLAQTRLDLRAIIYSLRRRMAIFDRFPTLSRNFIVAPLRLAVWAANMLIFSAVLQLGLMLPMVEIFHRVTFAGVGLNALAIPVMTLLLALALPINLLSVVSPAAAAWPAKVLSLVMALLFNMTHLPEMAAWLSYRMPTPPLWVACGFCAAFVLAALALRFAWRWVWMALAACAIFVGLVAIDPFPPRLPHGALELTALDCGQGDALFLVLPDGTTMLLDAGGSRGTGGRKGSLPSRRWDPGEDVVSPYLWSLGIKKIDVVAFSHAHQDHLGGLYAIFKNFGVGEFWHPASPESPEYASILEAAAEHRIPTRTLVAGDVLTLGDASVHVLWPGLDPPSGRASQNDDSLVMRISADGMNFLLPGDASKVAEEELLASPEPLGSQVLKVAHHGSNTSSGADFLARVAPRVAIISSGGPNNGVGEFPNSATVEALHNAGARIFRTDIDGATTVEWKDGSLVVRTYINPEGMVIESDGRKVNSN